MHETSVWCATQTHPRDDHARRASCQEFVSDAEETVQMMREAEEHDRHADTSGAESRYIEQ